MSTQLTEQGISLYPSYDPAHLQPVPDAVVVGNAMSRGNPLVEALLETSIPYTSGPQWLAENILRDRWIIAVSGTHGKTTTTSMIAWILEYAGLNPGFLIGGIPQNFGISARLGEGPFFVIEADEYDSAFFDKRSKFVHYRPKTLIMNNLEYDHADIFPDLAAIQRQFHHLVRTVPRNGLIIYPKADANLAMVLSQGCWTPVESMASDDARWDTKPLTSDSHVFAVYCDGSEIGVVTWSLLGDHNRYNALAAIAAANHAGVTPSQAVAALCEFEGVKRRLEIRGQVNGVTVYDDFAHHPTAITTTLAGLRQSVGNARIHIILECGSNTMRAGVHKDHLAPALVGADYVWLARPKGKDWGIDDVAKTMTIPAAVCDDVEVLIERVCQAVQPGDYVVIMSNTGFDGIHDRLLAALG